MVDVLILITTIVVAAILLAVSFYVLVVYVHSTCSYTQPTTKDGEPLSTARSWLS